VTATIDGLDAVGKAHQGVAEGVRHPLHDTRLVAAVAVAAVAGTVATAGSNRRIIPVLRHQESSVWLTTEVVQMAHTNS
jgi:hypothetical protein